MPFHLRIRLFSWLSLVYVLVGILSVVIFKWLIPEHYFNLYPLIGLFYWILGMILNHQLNRSRIKHPDHLFNTFMISRMVKLVLTIIFILVGVNFVGGLKLSFAISVMCNYFIYSTLEMYIYFMYNKRLTTNEGNKK